MIKTLKERVTDPNATPIRLTGTKFQASKKIIKVHAEPVEVEEILFEFNINEIIPVLKSMANSHGFVHGRISPMKQPTHDLTHVAFLVLTNKKNNEDVD